jgi:hypothetical protein
MTRPEVGSETELMPTPWPDNGNGDAPARFSHLDRLNAALVDDLASRTMDYRIPGWDGPTGWGVMVRLRALDYAQLSPIARRQMAALATSIVPQAARAAERAGRAPDPEAELKAACDGLVAACEDVYAVDDAGARIPLDNDDAAPCRFDARTCALLGQPEPANARDAVVTLFRGNKWQVVDAWDTYTEFATEGKAAATEALLGEG